MILAHLVVSHVLAMIDNANPTDILIVVNGALTVGLGALYRDCKRDRDRIWAHLGGRPKA